MKTSGFVFMGLCVISVGGTPILFAGDRHVNKSSIEAAKAIESPGWFCSGTAGKNVNLESVSLTPMDLKKGVECLAGDFDGNGFTDFLIFGKYQDRGKSVLSSPDKYLALFFQNDRLIYQLVVQHPKLSRPFLYPATNTKGEFGEPISKTDGFYEPGEGGTTVVFIYDPVSKQFKSSEHASEYE